MASFVPTKLNQAALDGIKQSMQGVTLSNVTPAPQQAPSANQTAYLNGLVNAGGGNAEWAKAQLAASPQQTPNVTSTPVAAQGVTPQPSQKPLIGPILTPTRPMVDVPAPVSASTPPVTNKPSASFTGTLPGPYPSYDANGKISSIQAGMKVVNGVPQPNVPAPMAASNSVPAPASQASSFPGQLTSAQIAAEAQARIDKQRAAITSATNAANAARKNVFDYTNQITGDNRTLENGAFNETHNPFTGQTGYAQANLQRNRSIQDTANNNNYQADITANNQKVTDFETLAPEQQQAILDQLTKQERDYGLQVGALTGQFNGQNTMQQNQNNFNNGIALGNLTGTYNGPVGGQGQAPGMMYAQGNPQGGQPQGVQTLAAKAQSFNQDQQGWQNRFNYGQATGTFDNGQQTLASQTAMAQLTGKMPDGTPTNAAQQQQLTNQWTLADQTGTIPNSLADFYGLPHGMQTQAAKNQAAQIGISQQNATNSKNSTDASIANMKDDNTRASNTAKQNQLMDVWKATGKAPAGIPNVSEGTPYAGQTTQKTTDYKTDPSFASDVAHLQASPTDAQKLNTNPQPFIAAYGYDGYLALRKAAGLQDPTAP